MILLCANKISALASLIHVLYLSTSSEAGGRGPRIGQWITDNVITELLNEDNESGETYRSYVYNAVNPTWNGDIPWCGGVIWRQDKRGMKSPGMKVVTSPDPISWRLHEPQSCLMSAGINPNTGAPKQCGDDHMTGKRFKAFSARCTGPIDLVFELVGEQGQAEVYRVFEKYKNLTPNTRLKGFKIELGTGIGDNFVPSTKGDGLSFTDRYGKDFNHWRATRENKDLGALFPFGLFGDADAVKDEENKPDVTSHHDLDGYYDPTGRARFELDPVSEDVIEAQNLTQNVANLYGEGSMESWISKKQAPYAFFYDHDDNDATESPLVADWDGTSWQTFLLCGSPIFQTLVNDAVMAPDECREDASVLPVKLSQDTTENLAASPRTSVGLIEDFAGVALNYHIKVEWRFVRDNEAFTLRLTPNADTETASTPPWLETLPWEADLGITHLSAAGNLINLDVKNYGPNKLVSGQAFIQVINDDGSVGFRKTLAISNLDADGSESFAVPWPSAGLEIPDEAAKVKAVVTAFAAVNPSEPPNMPNTAMIEL